MSRFLFIVLGLFVWLNGPAAAHEGRPLFIEIEEKETGAVFLKWRVPSTIDRNNAPQITLPDACERVQSPETAASPTLNIGQGLYDCRALNGPLTVSIAYPRGNPAVSSLVRVIRPSGEVQVIRNGPDAVLIDIPNAEEAGSIVLEYLILGVEHILTGYDHLLFVACLLMLAGTTRRVLLIVTGFTLAHSVTLALAALDIVSVPVAPLEAVIALSIVFVAAELARPARDTLTWRYPILISSGFGLLHGFGFAAVLGEIGLPQTEVPLALLFFNLGVEVGQIAFILFLVAITYVGLRVIALVKEDAKTWGLKEVTLPTAYLVGSLAALWSVERFIAVVA
ncbi:MAG: HupE/UreJ family protein [Rhodobiaceae bacterium]|nr:HupE/UreJ family protein [Rhodobiaceae bacterium]